MIPAKTPKPRDSNFMGMKESASISPDGTWLEPEAITYPSGGFHRRARAVLRVNEHNPVTLPYGQLRVVRCSIPDTAWTIPARLKYRGQTIKGFLSWVDRVLTFTPDANPETCPGCKLGEGCKK